jgi:hypothetical protein
MSGTSVQSARLVAEEIDEKDGISLADLVERLGEASGQELFERIDGQLRRGDRVYGTTVREARKLFKAARTPGHAQFVVPGRIVSAQPGDTAGPDNGMVMITLSDLEAVVKAKRVDFDWRNEFAPRRALAVATTPMVVRSGVPARRMLRP